MDLLLDLVGCARIDLDLLLDLLVDLLMDLLLDLLGFEWTCFDLFGSIDGPTRTCLDL